MNVLPDTNILLDVLLDREPWVSDSKAIARRLVGSHDALEAVSLLLDAFEVASIGRDVLEHGCQLSGRDFEDDVLIAASLRFRLDAIVTRDRAGFAAGARTLGASIFRRADAFPRGSGCPRRAEDGSRAGGTLHRRRVFWH